MSNGMPGNIETVDSAGAGNIKVVVRCRPLNAREKARGAQCLVRMDGSQTTIVPPGNDDAAAKDRERERREHTFSFDKSYWSAGDPNEPNYASQQTLYQDVGIELLDHSFAGYNVCTFAYGQTSSGKTYSMVGYGSDKGVIPLVTEELFARIDSKTAADPKLEFRVEVSYMEIYNEKVRDLLNPKNKGALKVREHPSLGPYVEDLSRLVVESYSQMMTVMDEGNKARTVASTAMNETSSRSHAVFTVILTQKRHDEATKMAGEKVSKISLVDLAGSERANSTGATGARLKEGANINRSLTTLGKVIQALSTSTTSHTRQKKKKDEFVPYRDSVLTWLLKESLGGNSRTCMIAAISPADYEETLSTLRYADQAKRIKTNAVVNEDPNAKMIRELKEELAVLRQRAAGGSSEAVFDESTPPEKQIVSYKTKTGEIRTVTKLELQENLEASEKLMASLNESWEDKLAKTREIHVAREQALEELGISLDKDRTLVGVHAPKKWPHLVNLNEDPLQNECLLYSIPEGRILVGNIDSTTAAIKLSSPRILEEHCAFVNDKGKVSIEPFEQATVLVNGKLIPPGSATPLESGFRIIIDWHVFRFSSPQSVRAQRMRESTSFSGALADMHAEETQVSDYGKDTGIGHVVDWTFARKEALSRLTLTGDDLDMLGDEELDGLFQDITRARTSRRRPESQVGTPKRLRAVQVMDRARSPDTSTPASMVDNPWNDDLSDRDMLTVPTTVQPASDKVDVASKVDTDVSTETIEESSQRRQPSRAGSNLQMDRMAEEIRLLRQLALQNRFESLSTRLSGVLLDREKDAARQAVRQWRSVRLIAMAKAMRQQSASVEEANRLADKHATGITYRLVASRGAPASSMETHVESILFDAEATHSVTRANGDIVILVIDKARMVAYVWSTEKLQRQLPFMRKLGSKSDAAHRPAPETAFRTVPCPSWTHLGTTMFALHPRIAGPMQLPIQCIETAEAVGNMTVRVAWDELIVLEGLTERSKVATISLSNVRAFAEGITSAHMQLRLPTFGIGGKRENLRSSDITDLTETSAAHMKLKETFGLDISPDDQPLYIQVDFFGKVTGSYLKNLEDRIPIDPAEPKSGSSIAKQKPSGTVEHTMTVHITVLEPDSQGIFVPADYDVKDAVFTLRQGRQRHIRIELIHNSARSLDWKGINFVTLRSQNGDERDVVNLSPTHHGVGNPDNSGLLTQQPTYRGDGTGLLGLTCKFEDLPGMEKKTPNGQHISCQLSFQVSFTDHRVPALVVQNLRFRITGSQTRRRSAIMDYLRPPLLAAHSSRTFELQIPSENMAAMTTSQMALLTAYLDQRKRQYLIADVQAAAARIEGSNLEPRSEKSSEVLLRQAVQAWTETVSQRRFPRNLSDSVTFRLAQDGHMRLNEVFISTRVDKEGWIEVLTSPAEGEWTRRYARLTRPYLRLFESNDLRQEDSVIFLENANYDEADDLEIALETTNVFSIAATTNTTVYRTTNLNERNAWLKALKWN